MTNPVKYLEYGSRILSVGSILLLLASLAIVSDGLEMDSRLGRHGLAGALANACLAMVLFLVARYPLRQGQKWAFWAFLIPLFVYGLPILAVDISFVQPDRLWITILPQLCGLSVLVVGLVLSYLGIFKRS